MLLFNMTNILFRISSSRPSYIISIISPVANKNKNMVIEEYRKGFNIRNKGFDEYFIWQVILLWFFPWLFQQNIIFFHALKNGEKFFFRALDLYQFNADNVPGSALIKSIRIHEPFRDFFFITDLGFGSKTVVCWYFAP